jgi:hypothetical protein
MKLLHLFNENQDKYIKKIKANIAYDIMTIMLISDFLSIQSKQTKRLKKRNAYEKKRNVCSEKKN